MLRAVAPGTPSAETPFFALALLLRSTASSWEIPSGPFLIDGFVAFQCMASARLSLLHQAQMVTVSSQGAQEQAALHLAPFARAAAERK